MSQDQVDFFIARIEALTINKRLLEEEINHLKDENLKLKREIQDSEKLGLYDIDIDIRSDKSLYVTMDDVTFYIDNSTNERIVDITTEYNKVK